MMRKRTAKSDKNAKFYRMKNSSSNRTRFSDNEIEKVISNIDRRVKSAKNNGLNYIFFLEKLEDVRLFDVAIKNYCKKHKDIKMMSHAINEWKLVW